MIPRRFAEHAKCLKELGANLYEVGFTGRGHIKMQVTYGNHRRFFIMSNTPSDRRAFANWQGDIRKWLASIKEETHGRNDLPNALQEMPTRRP
jgi:hypothetical protein